MIWWARFCWFINTGFFTAYLGFGVGPGTAGSLFGGVGILMLLYYSGFWSF